MISKLQESVRRVTLVAMKKLLLPVLLLSIMPVFAQTSFGRRAPGFSLPDSKFKQHDLQDYRGKVLVMDFMSTGCPNCQELTQRLEEVKAKLGDKILVFSVVTGPDTQASVAGYVAKSKTTSTFLFDCGQMTGSYLQVTPQNPTVHFPRLLMIDKGGMIRRDLQSLNEMTVPALVAALTELVK